MILFAFLPIVLIAIFVLTGVGVLIGIKKQNDDLINISATILILAIIGMALYLYLIFLLSQAAPT